MYRTTAAQANKQTERRTGRPMKITKLVVTFWLANQHQRWTQIDSLDGVLSHTSVHRGNSSFLSVLLCPRPVGGGIKRWSASVVRLSVCLSVCLMSRTSALTQKPKGLWRRNFAQGYPRLHATPTPTSRSKGQKSRWGGGILWRRPSRTACLF